MAAQRGSIDVHFHSVPPAYRAAVNSGQSFSFPVRTPDWSPEMSLELMDRHDMGTVITSISVPGTHFGDDAAARELSRRCNEYSAECNDKWPGRFGAFAAVPLPDVDGTIAEIDYALDTLNLDGIGLFTSYGGDHLGHPRFDPVLDALDRHKAVAFIHPTAHPSTQSVKMGVPPYLLEYPFDTTRMAVNLIFSGALDRFPNIRFILSHAGGALPFLSWRVGELAATLLAEPASREKFPVSMIEENSGNLTIDTFVSRLKRFWYDTANAAGAQNLRSLEEIADPERILFGTDWPYVPDQVVTDTVATLERSLPEIGQRENVRHRNAIKLFPRLG